MIIEPLINSDLPEIASLQPPDWPDIIPNIRFYIESPFCKPIKVLVDNKLVGIGSTIEFKNTAWLAHIIVDQRFRNKGIGNNIVEHLLGSIDKKQFPSILLIATALGEPVYVKAGFRKVTDYLFFKRSEPWKQHSTINNCIIPFNDQFREQIHNLDKEVTAEDRCMLLDNYLTNSVLYVENGNLYGYYLPTLGEGTIIANTPEAGLALMKLKYSVVDKAVLPAENVIGMDLLKQNGFTESSKCSRMILGKDIPWKPGNIYSRIAGNFG